MIYVDKSSKEPLYEQLYNSLVNEICSGAIATGERLPATRKLAKELNLGRNTVDRAYQQLVIEGYIQPKTGSGFVVNWVPVNIESEHKPGVVELSEETTPDVPIICDFSFSAMDNSLFPYNQWRKCVNNVLYDMEMRDAIDYPSRIGEKKLREEIAAYLKRARDVNCTPNQIIITGGQQYSMVIIADMFRDNKTFTMEDPGYDGIRHIFANHEYEIHGLHVDESGIMLDELEGHKTKLLYVTPSHHFPTGGVIPVGNRHKLIEWAQENDAYIIEDDYDSELRYYTNPVPSLQSLDTLDRVIYTGCFSKSLAPSMRIAYVVLPASLMDRYNDYYHRYHSQVDVFHQLTLAEFMASGNYDRHINKLRTSFKKKQEVLINGLHRVFGDKISIRGEGAGIYLIVRIESPLTQEELVNRAKAAGILVYSTRAFYMNASECPSNELLMGFATLPVESVENILQTLKSAWEID